MAILTKAERTTLQHLLRDDVVDWMEHNFFIPDPRNMTTGELLPPGPIKLHPIQKRILRAALEKDTDGLFKYTTILFSTIKKSGKTRVAAGVAAWYADTQGAFNEVYCLANDGKQSSDRILRAVKHSVTLSSGTTRARQSRTRQSRTSAWRVTRTTITLPSSTFIESIPCDPKGSAGANPGLTVWSELWGYSRSHKERLWSEMTIPPTRFGRALRWVESYAGYKNESNVLWNLFVLGTKGSRRHPAFPDLPVTINDAAKLFCYWDEGDGARRMPWQTADYYAQERNILNTEEFDRIHRNLWIDPITKAIHIEWWDACQTVIQPLTKRTPLVMAIDASVSRDCSACVLISRDPHSDRKMDCTQVRAVRVWVPPKGGVIDLDTTVQDTMYEWKKNFNVVEVAYDKYQLHQMMTNARRQGIKVYDFSQGGERNLADKSLFDMILSRRITHSGDQVLREHVDNAAVKTTNEKFRFVKPVEGEKSRVAARHPIDALVAVSMGNHRCLHLLLA